jgi:hypothetical protein
MIETIMQCRISVYPFFALYFKFQPQHTNSHASYGSVLLAVFCDMIPFTGHKCAGRELSFRSGTSIDIRKYRAILQSLGEGNESRARYGTSDIWILIIYLVSDNANNRDK